MVRRSRRAAEGSEFDGHGELRSHRLIGLLGAPRLGKLNQLSWATADAPATKQQNNWKAKGNLCLNENALTAVSTAKLNNEGEDNENISRFVD